MFEAIISAFLSLSLVLIFILLLHFYARCYYNRGREQGLAPVAPFVFGARLYHMHNFLVAGPTNINEGHNTMMGLGSLAISSIPKFEFQTKTMGNELDCVICLSLFQDKELGRKLRVCGHCFHVECIDMWLHSHTNCPICRTPAVKVSVYGEVLGTSYMEHAIDGINDHPSVGELVRTNLDEINGEEENRLEIVIENPNMEIEMNGGSFSRGKLHSSSNENPRNL